MKSIFTLITLFTVSFAFAGAPTAQQAADTLLQALKEYSAAKAKLDDATKKSNLVANSAVVKRTLGMSTALQNRGCYEVSIATSVCQYTYEGGRADLLVQKTSKGFMVINYKEFAY